MKIHILASTNRQYFFRVVARNGKILAHSETYWSKQDCINAARILKDEGGSAQIIDGR